MYYSVSWGSVLNLRWGERGGTMFPDPHPVDSTFETKMAAL